MSNNAMSDELVSQFMAFTGSSDASKAASYLEMSGGNVETAVSLFMDHEQQQQQPQQGVAAVEPQIRAPDETRTMRLMDDNNNPMSMMQQDPSFQLMNAMMEEQMAQTAFGTTTPVPLQDVRAAVNAAAAANRSNYYDHAAEAKEMDTAEDDDDDDDVQIVAAAASGQQPAGLSDMFAPPHHLIHKAGGFQGARAMAKDTKRWLLVNIQKDSEFSSHALNRDVWRDELVENLIREGFIFWQQVCNTRSAIGKYCRKRAVFRSSVLTDSSLLLCISWISLPKDVLTRSATKWWTFLTWALLIPARVDSCGVRRAGPWRIP